MARYAQWLDGNATHYISGGGSWTAPPGTFKASVVFQPFQAFQPAAGADTDTMEVPYEFDGTTSRTFRVVKSSGSSGLFLVETSDTWDTSS